MSFVSDIKAALDAPLDGRVFRDSAPPDTAFPYATIFEDVLRVPVTSGDGRTSARKRRMQVSIFQLMTAEDETLIAEAEVACELADKDGGRTRATVTFSQRMPYNPEFPNISHRVLWVEVGERVPVT